MLDVDLDYNFMFKKTSFKNRKTEDYEDAIPLVYGSAKIEIKPIFIDAFAPKIGTLVNLEDVSNLIVLVIAEGEIGAVKQIYCGETKVLKDGIELGDGIVEDENLSDEFKLPQEFKHLRTFEIKTGTSDQSRITSSQGYTNYDETKKGENVALLAISTHFLYTSLKDLKGESFSIEILGRKIKRLELDQSIGLSTNPASCLYDLITNKRFGAGISESDINIQSFIAAAAYADRRGLKCEGRLDTANTIKEICKNITQIFNGDLFEHNGQIHLGYKSRSPVSVMNFDESTIINKIEIEHGESRVKNNMLVGTYTAGEEKHTVTIPKKITADMLADGSLKSKKIDYPMISNKATAERVMNIDYQSMRPRKKVKFEAGIEAFKLKPFDAITITESHNKLDKKQFIIEEIDRSLTSNLGRSSIIATEYIDTDFTSTEPITPPKAIDLKGRFTVKPPTNLKLESKSFTDFSNGILSWKSALDVEVKEYLTEYKLSSSNIWLELDLVRKTSLPVRNLKSGIYDFSVKSLNRFGVTSDRVILNNIDMSDSRVYPSITNVAIANNKASTTESITKDWLISWDDATVNAIEATGTTTDGETLASYFSHYEIKIIAGTTVKRVERSPIPRFTYSYSDALNDGLSRQLKFEVRFVSKSGAKSQAGSLNAVNNQSLLPSGIKVKGGIAGLFLEFSPPKELDHDGVNIYISKTKNFTPSNENLESVLVNSNSYSKAYTVLSDETYYLKIAAFDAFGKDNLAFSSQYEFTINEIVEFEMPKITDSMLVGDLAKEIEKIPVNAAAIAKEVNDRTNAVTKNADDLAKEALNRVSGDKALDTKITALTAKANGNESAIVTEKTARATADTALGKRIDVITATANGNASKIATETTARATADTALGKRIDVITATANGNASKIATEATTRATADAAATKLITAVTAKAAANASAISTEKTATASKRAALGKRIDAMSASIGSATALVNRVSAVEASVKGKAAASTVSTLQTTVNGHTASVNASASAINGMKSRYTIRVGSNGLIAGVGLMTDSTTKKAEVSILASKFYVVNSAADIGKAAFIPFAVSGGRTYIQDACIRNASITDAKIATISASKIKTGTLSASQTISAGRAHMGNGAGNYRFWAGSAVGGAATAPFSVNDDGVVAMQKGTIGKYTVLNSEDQIDKKAATSLMRMKMPAGTTAKKIYGVNITNPKYSTGLRVVGEGDAAFFMSGITDRSAGRVTLTAITNVGGSTAIRATAVQPTSYALEIAGNIKHNGQILKGVLVTTQNDFMGWKNIYNNAAGLATNNPVAVSSHLTKAGANWEIMVIYGKGTEHFCCRFFLPNGYYLNSALSMKFNGDTGGTVYIYGTKHTSNKKGAIYSSNRIYKVYVRQVEMRA